MHWIYGLKGPAQSIWKSMGRSAQLSIENLLAWVHFVFKSLWIEEHSFDFKSNGLVLSPVIYWKSVDWRGLLYFENLWLVSPVVCWKSMDWRAQFHCKNLWVEETSFDFKKPMDWWAQLYLEHLRIGWAMFTSSLYGLESPAIFWKSMGWKVQLYCKSLWVEETSFDVKNLWVGEPSFIMRIYGLTGPTQFRKSMDWGFHFLENNGLEKPHLFESMDWRSQFWFSKSAGWRTQLLYWKSMDWSAQLFFESLWTGEPCNVFPSSLQHSLHKFEAEATPFRLVHFDVVSLLAASLFTVFQVAQVWSLLLFYLQDRAPQPCRPNLQTVVLLSVPQFKEEQFSWNELILAIVCKIYAMISHKTSFPSYFTLGVCVVFVSFLRRCEKFWDP